MDSNLYLHLIWAISGRSPQEQELEMNMGVNLVSVTNKIALIL